MDDITFNTISTSEKTSSAISEQMTAPKTATNIQSIRELIEHGKNPEPMETTTNGIQHGLQSVEDKLNEPASEELKSEFKALLDEWREISGDQDGDGIPDGWDKNPGMTVADVAAYVLKLGKYANDNKALATTKISSVAKSVKSLLTSLNKLSEQLANLEGYKNEATRVQSMIDRIDPKGILAMDGGILG